MNLKTHGFAAIAAVSCCAAAQAASPQLPPSVARAVKETAAMCTEVGGKADTSQAVHRADLNGDGIEDYVFDVRGINCEGAASIYGDREMAVTVFVADARGGAREAFTASVFGMSVQGTGAAAKLWLTVMGEACGKKPARDFASEQFCDRPVVWNAKTQKFDWAAVSTVKMIQ